MVFFNPMAPNTSFEHPDPPQSKHWGPACGLPVRPARLLWKPLRSSTSERESGPVVGPGLDKTPYPGVTGSMETGGAVGLSLVKVRAMNAQLIT